MKEVTAILKKTLLFKNLDGKNLHQLAKPAVEQKYDRKAILFSAGEKAQGLFIIAKGSAGEYCLKSSGERRQVISIENAPATVAEASIFGDGLYYSTVIAEEKTQTLFIEKKHIYKLYVENPSFAIDYLKVLGIRLRSLEALTENLALYDVTGRLIRFILSEADTRGKTKNGEIYLKTNLTQEQIAARIGTVREVVSRNLNILRSEGLIRFENRQLIITDKENFAKFANKSTK